MFFKNLLKIKYFLLIGILLIPVWFIIHNIIIIKEGTTNDFESADVGIIFGAKNQKNGELSRSLLERLNVGLKLYKDKQIDKIIVTGGIAHKGICEADLMLEYLLNHGVPPSDIITDTKAKNTQENVENSLKLIKQNKFRKVIIISEYYHIARIKLVFDKYHYDFNNLESASLYNNHIKKYHFKTYFREFLAYYYYYFFV